MKGRPGIHLQRPFSPRSPKGGANEEARSRAKARVPEIGPPQRGSISGRASSALVVAFGNPLRRDDGVAHHVAARLEGRLPADAAIVCAQTPGPELAEAVARAERVVFVDACLECQLAAVQLAAGAALPALFHAAGPEVLLALAAALYEAHPAAWIVAVPATDLGFGEGLSPACERLVDPAAELVAALVEPALPSVAVAGAAPVG